MFNVFVCKNKSTDMGRTPSNIVKFKKVHLRVIYSIRYHFYKKEHNKIVPYVLWVHMSVCKCTEKNLGGFTN